MPQQSIFITGCSSGIGLSAATTLKQRGYRVFAAARKSEDLAHLTSLGLEAIKLDLDSTDSIKQAAAQVLDLTGGTLDALFNNAGYLVAGGIEDLTRDMDRRQFETNVFGPMELTRLIIPVMRKQGHGRIIFNSSILGVVALPYYGAYNASKFALEGFVNTLRLEMRDLNIKVSLINPGPIESKLRQHAFEHYEADLKSRPNKANTAAYERLEKTYFSSERKDKALTAPPEAVVKQLIHALEAKNPNAHYFIGAPAKVMACLRRILPDSAMDWLISKIKE